MHKPSCLPGLVLAGLVLVISSPVAVAHRLPVVGAHDGVQAHADRPVQKARRLAIAKRWAALPPAARDALALERLYRRQGKPDDVVALYQDVLARSTDPQTRQLAFRRLARLAWRQGDSATAEAHLRASLDEQLSRR